MRTEPPHPNPDLPIRTPPRTTQIAPPPAQYIALRRLGAQPQAQPHQTIKLNEIMFFYGKIDSINKQWVSEV